MDNFTNIIAKAHSGIRYLVLLFLVLALVAAFIGWFSKGKFTKTNRILNLCTMIFTHLQALLGIYLYIFSPRGFSSGDPYFKMEHISTMLVAVILITIGNSKSKKAITTAAKHRSIAIYFGIALILIVVTVLHMVMRDILPSFFGSRVM